MTDQERLARALDVLGERLDAIEGSDLSVRRLLWVGQPIGFETASTLAWDLAANGMRRIEAGSETAAVLAARYEHGLLVGITLARIEAADRRDYGALDDG